MWKEKIKHGKEKEKKKREKRWVREKFLRPKHFLYPFCQVLNFANRLSGYQAGEPSPNWRIKILMHISRELLGVTIWMPPIAYVHSSQFDIKSPQPDYLRYFCKPNN